MGRPQNKGVLNSENRQFFTDNVLNWESYNHYLRALKKLAISMFEWDLPEEMDARWLEEVLYYNGMASLLKTEDMGFINTAVAPSGNLNVYGLPSILNCFSYGFHEQRFLFTGNVSEEEKANDCILVWNCLDHIDTYASMELFAYRMYLADRVCDINLNGMKTPILLLADEKTKLSMINAYAQYDGNKPVIVGKKGQFSKEDFDSIDTHVDFQADKVQDYKRVIWNEVLTFLGINNIDTKRERLVSEEINQNNEVINLNLESFYAPRKNAVEQFNKLYGDEYKISVKLRSDLANTIKKTESIVTPTFEMEEGEEIDNK